MNSRFYRNLVPNDIAFALGQYEAESQVEKKKYIRDFHKHFRVVTQGKLKTRYATLNFSLKIQL